MNREKAIQIVDKRVNSISGMSVHDLGDTCEFCDIYDTIEDMEEEEAIAYVKENVDMEMIEENVFG